MFDYSLFRDLLVALNEKLKKAGKTIEIYAIGGFAMMCNAKTLNFESRGFSVDIDSYESYDDEVERLIAEIAEEKDLDEGHWLNTEWRQSNLKRGS